MIMTSETVCECGNGNVKVKSAQTQGQWRREPLSDHSHTISLTSPDTPGHR